eukprot:SAG31_NODE_3329_length_4400_cov_2.494071_1_plen_102_part_00
MRQARRLALSSPLRNLVGEAQAVAGRPRADENRRTHRARHSDRTDFSGPVLLRRTTPKPCALCCDGLDVAVNLPWNFVSMDRKVDVVTAAVPMMVAPYGMS